jgi:hypothetical protein
MDDDVNPKLLKDIGEMIEKIQAITQEATAQLKPQVLYIIRNNITAHNQIERLLDSLLDYAGMCDDGLYLFKRLCRYYYPINPQATAEYVYTYRDLYDSDNAAGSEIEA